MSPGLILRNKSQIGSGIKLYGDSISTIEVEEPYLRIGIWIKFGHK